MVCGYSLLTIRFRCWNFSFFIRSPYQRVTCSNTSGKPHGPGREQNEILRGVRGKCHQWEIIMNSFARLPGTHKNSGRVSRRFCFHPAPTLRTFHRSYLGQPNRKREICISRLVLMCLNYCAQRPGNGFRHWTWRYRRISSRCFMNMEKSA